MDKLLDRILKIFQIISIPIGSYIAYLGMSHRSLVLNHNKGYGVLWASDPVISLLIAGVVIIAAGTFVIGYRRGKK